MNVFVDCGCYDGDTIMSLVNFEPMMKWKFDLIIGFDISPNFEKSWDGVKAYNREREIYFYQEAVWTKSDVIQAAIMPEGKETGNTIHPKKGKFNEKTAKKIKVKSFDFSQWLRKYKDDRVIVKMDIEGAEYPVMEKMIQDGTDTIPELMMVEFHWAKMKNHDEKMTKDLIKRYKGNVVEWL